MNYHTTLEKFALDTLAILQDQQEWDADTADDISVAAMNAGLASCDDDGMFAIANALIEEEPEERDDYFSLLSQKIAEQADERLELHPARRRAWAVHLSNGRRRRKGYYADDFATALSYFKNKCKLAGVGVDWESLTFSVGSLFVVSNEHSGGITSRVFNSAEDLLKYKRDELGDYPPHLESSTEVEDLSTAGNIDTAWSVAHEENDLHETQFGFHLIEQEPNLMRFYQLPRWIQAAAVAYFGNTL